MKEHFDKLLLSLLFLGALLMAEHVMHHSPDVASTQWIEGIVGQVLAALLTLMVGNRMTSRNSDSNGKNGAPADPGQKS